MSDLVSIIMNCKDGEEYLLESLQSILDQTYKNWELIFVDNNSKDNSKNIFLDFKDSRFKYFYINKSVSLGMARQYAYEKCNGKFIAFLDTDDLWLATKLEKQILLFDNNEIGLVICNSMYFSHDKEKVFYNKKPHTGYVFYKLLENYFISLETIVCKKKYLDQISFKFNSEYSMISDYELCIRLSAVCNLEYYNEVLTKCRIHSDSESVKKKELIYCEKFNFLEKLSNESFEKKYKHFLYNKKKIFHKMEVAQIIDKLENGIEKIKVFKSMKKILIFDIIVFILLIIPFSKYLIRFYRNYFSVRA
jgi:glycosyltransferase involved in cell wall biosynthesis